MLVTTAPPSLPLDKAKQRRQTRLGYLIGGGVLAGAIVIGALTKLIGVTDQPNQPNPKDEAVARDINELDRAGKSAVRLGDAIKSNVSGWNSSLDLTIGTRSADRAEHLADYMCHRFFGNAITQGLWKVRVYLVDGSEGAECTIN
jgi:phosphoribosylformylglycinamidine (FGAM) synthase PurS component